MAFNKSQRLAQTESKNALVAGQRLLPRLNDSRSAGRQSPRKDNNQETMTPT